MLPVLLLLSLACESTNAPDCTDNGMCGEGQACVKQVCKDVECLASEQCQIHQYCRTADETYVCVDGCTGDDDCAAGEECNTSNRQCEPYGCRSTVLDCPVGTSCDDASGECETWDGELCQHACDVYDQPRCGGGESCQVVSFGDACRRDADCGGTGACDQFLTSLDTCRNLGDCPEGTEECTILGQCVASYCHVDYCLPQCFNGDSETCPAGFSCESDGESGYICYGDCQYYLDNGYL